MRVGVLTVLVLLATPLAGAGSAREPDIEDAADTRDPGADVLAAWFEAEEEGLRFSIRIVDGSRPERVADHTYWVLLRNHETGLLFSGTLGFGTDDVLRGHLGSGGDMGGLNGRAWDRGGFDRVANGKLADVQGERGRPATWSATIPWGAVEGLEPGVTLDDLRAGSAIFDRRAGVWRGGIDGARSDATFTAVIATGHEGGAFLGLFPILVPAWMIPTLVAACVAGGALAGAGFARAARPKREPTRALAPDAPRVAPPGERFRVTPGQRR